MTPHRLRIDRVIVRTSGPVTPQQAEQMRNSIRRELAAAVDTPLVRAASSRERVLAPPVRASTANMASGVAKSVRNALGGE
jgi:hypothetical protein